jgi:ABC-2 type transport system permease protein
MTVQREVIRAVPPVEGKVNWRAVNGIIRKDLRMVTQSKSVMLPMLIIPMIFVLLIPVGMIIGFNYFAAVIEKSSDFQDILKMLPASLRERYADLSVVQVVALYAFRYMFAPMHLILPIMTSSVIAADAFAGERERKTLEALLYTPTSDFELLLAKRLGALVPGVLVAWLSAVIYWIIVDIGAWPMFGRPILPDATWLLLALWVAPAAAAMALGATVIVSSRAKSFQDANQISGLVVLPIVVLMVAQASGITFMGVWLTFVVGLVFWLLAAVLYVIGARTLRRSELLARL